MFSSNNQIDVSEMNENYYVVSNKKSIFIAIGIVFIIPAIALTLIGLFNSDILYTMLICSGGLVLVYLWFYVMLNNERFTCSYGHYEFRSPWGRKKEFEASDIGYAKLYLPNSIILYNREGKKLCTIPCHASGVDFFVKDMTNRGFIPSLPTPSENAESSGNHPVDEIPSEYRKTHVERVQKVSRISIPVGIVASIACAIYFGSTMFYGLAFIVVMVVYTACDISLTKARRLAKNSAKRYPAKIVSTVSTKEQEAYFVEFTDENNNLHQVGAAYAKKNKLSKLPPVSPHIYYCPEYLDEAYMDDGSNDPLATKFSITFWIRTIIFAIISAFLAYLMLDSQMNFSNPINKDGKAMEITWEKEYTPTETTQNDIEGDFILWLNASYGVHTHMSALNSHYYGQAKLTDEKNIERLRNSLEVNYGIKDRDSAIAVFNKMLEHGGRQTYAKTIKEMKKNHMLEYDSVDDLEDSLDSDDENYYRYVGSYLAYQTFGDIGVDAWDYTRILRIVSNSYVLGYITLEEALDQSLPIAQKLQEEFSSWSEVRKSYLYGYMMWYKSNDANIEAYLKSYRSTLIILGDGTSTEDRDVPFKLKLEKTW